MNEITVGRKGGSSTMSSVANDSPPLTALLTYGRTLGSLLRKAKVDMNCTYHLEVKEAVSKLLEDLNLAQGVASFPEESMCKLFRKVEQTLVDFMKLDFLFMPHYQAAAASVRSMKRRMQSTSVALLLKQGDNTCYRETISNDFVSKQEFEATYEGLTKEEKLCLLCFTLFPSDVQIKKRELIHLWIGMDLIDFSNCSGDQMLANLVAEGFVERVPANKRLSGLYLMNNNIQQRVLEQCANDSLGYQHGEGSWCILYRTDLGRQFRGSTPPRDDCYRAEKIEVLLNRSEKTLSAKRFQPFSKLEKVKVLHLGSWQHDPKNYIVVDDIDMFRDLKHLGDIQVLSLQGLSGIVKLPESIYKLKNLKVLDLKACHNLELIPEGIDALKQLIHLDLSECYLLNLVPRGIATLSRLQVLKGFLINRHDNLDAPPEDRLIGKRNKHKNRIAFVPYCMFWELSKLEELRKLTIRTRSMNFPTNSNLKTLCQMKKLVSLRIAWVGSAKDASEDVDSLEEFPPTVQKMELQAAPEHMSWRILRLLSHKDNDLQKLYIRGGGLRGVKNVHLIGVKAVRLRYLHNLHIDWNDLKELFPNITRLEVLECPNIYFSPCDENGVWEAPFQARMSPGLINYSLTTTDSHPITTHPSKTLYPPPPPPPPPPPNFTPRQPIISDLRFL